MVLTIPFKITDKFNRVIRYFGNKSRYETMTDVVFLNDEYIVCADRTSKVLHLVNFDYVSGISKIVHSVNIPHNPDLIERIGNFIYVANLNDYLTVCEVIDNNSKIVLRNNIPIKFGCQYHGVGINPNNNKELFLDSTHKYKIITHYNIDLGVVNHLVIPKLENCYMKDIVFISADKALIVGCDSGPSPTELPYMYRSHLNLYHYENGNFTYLDGVTYKDCHMDSVVFAKGRYFVTAQIYNNGALLTGQIEENFIVPMKDISVDDFTHGLAISKSQKYIAYTSYSKDTVTIDLLENILG
jgi:hypothetical protein